MNPSDLVTRSIIEEEAITEMWLSGPEFLRKAEKSRPEDVPWMTVTEKLRPARVHLASVRGESPFDWDQVTFTPKDIPELARMEGWKSGRSAPEMP